MHLLAAVEAATQEPMSFADWWALWQSKVAIIALAVSTSGLLVSLSSAISSHRSSRSSRSSSETAKKTLAINLETAEAARRKILVDFTKAFAVPYQGGTLYVFDLKFSNPATRANAITEARLKITFADGSDGFIDPAPHSSIMPKRKFLNLPLAINASSQEVGALAYECSNKFLRDRVIKRYCVNAVDSSGRNTSIETVMMIEGPRQ